MVRNIGSVLLVFRRLARRITMEKINIALAKTSIPQRTQKWGLFAKNAHFAFSQIDPVRTNFLTSSRGLQMYIDNIAKVEDIERLIIPKRCCRHQDRKGYWKLYDKVYCDRCMKKLAYILTDRSYNYYGMQNKKPPKKRSKKTFSPPAK